MKALFAIAGVAVMGVTGCAATAMRAPAEVELTEREPALRMSGSSIVSHVSPLIPVDVSSENGSIKVRFAQRGRMQATARLDAASGQVQSVQTGGTSEAPQAAAWGPARVELEGGRFIVLWTQEGRDGSRRAMARLWAANGSALGDAMAISPEDADVLGSPKAASADGHHAVVTFASTSGRGFELRAVSLEDASRWTETNEQTAAR